MRILIVEDSETAAEAVRAHLALAGADSDHARDGGEAMALLRACRYDGAVVDLCMPGLGGLDFLRLAFQTGRLTAVPVAVVTATPGRDVPALAAELRGFGNVTLLRKPAGSAGVLAALGLAEGGEPRGE